MNHLSIRNLMLAKCTSFTWDSKPIGITDIGFHAAIAWREVSVLQHDGRIVKRVLMCLKY